MSLVTRQSVPIATLPPKLTPLVSHRIQRLLSDPSLVFQLLDGLGSPLNVLFPQNVRPNIHGFHKAFADNQVTGRIFFAHKCNQSDSLLRQMSIEETNVDVSSCKELQHALSNGFVGERIECTGPKAPDLIALSIQHGAWINVDSVPELKTVINLSRQVHSAPPIRVLLRLCGFTASHSHFIRKDSRFGIPLSEIRQAFELLEENPQINLSGFSFHLDTVSVLERTVAIESCIDIFEEALNYGFSPAILDIGGGFKVNYLASESEWNQFTTALKESALGTAPALTWHGNSFGLHAEKGVLKGSFNTYAYHDSQTGGQFLHELLQQKLRSQGGASLASFLRDNMIELWIEPGRALVDQCGITIARVESVHNSSAGETLVNLAMKRQDIAFLDQEIFVDPVILHRKPPTTLEPMGVYFAGNLCLESDLIYRHKTHVEACPSATDAVVFINTAGYFMDFSATQSIMHPIGRKVAISEQDEHLHWCMDELYSPFKRST